MPVHVFAQTGRTHQPEKSRRVALDPCIAMTIGHLWNNGIVTLGCCCGHNEKNPDVVIMRDYTDEDIARIREIIAKVDDREWDILQWRLVKT